MLCLARRLGVARAARARPVVARPGAAAASRFFNVCETINLYYNDLIVVLCPGNVPTGQGPVIFLSTMRKNVNSIIHGYLNIAAFSRALAAALVVAVLSPVPAFSQEKPQTAAGPRTVEAIQADLRAPEMKLRRAALQELRRSTSPLKIDLLKAEMDNGDPLVRGGAVRALGETGDKSVLPALFEALSSSDTQTRLGAIEALGLLKDPSAVEPLAGLLQDKSKNIRWSAVLALGAIGGRQAVAPLLGAAETESVTYVRQAAIEALGEIGDNSAAPALRKLLKDKDEAVGRKAASALVKLGYEKK